MGGILSRLKGREKKKAIEIERRRDKEWKEDSVMMMEKEVARLRSFPNLSQSQSNESS